MISKRAFTKSKTNSYFVNHPPKKPTTKDKTKLLSFQKVGLDNRQPRVTGIFHSAI
jgi:hypothetical protein